MAPDRLQRRFLVSEPDRFWLADIMAVWTLEGWLYLAALEMAVGRCRPGPGWVNHSDRGSKYAARAHQETLEKHGMEASMSRKGNCSDNAVMERFFGSLTSEWLADQRYLTREQARRNIVPYIEMKYNSNRLHSKLGYTPHGNNS